VSQTQQTSTHYALAGLPAECETLLPTFPPPILKDVQEIVPNKETKEKEIQSLLLQEGHHEHTHEPNRARDVHVLGWVRSARGLINLLMS